MLPIRLEKEVLVLFTRSHWRVDFVISSFLSRILYFWCEVLCLKMQGVLADGTVIAVKQLSAKSKQGNREFVNEIGMISALQHPHLVKLYGCCIEGNQLLLIYEYLENNSLARALFGKNISVLLSTIILQNFFFRISVMTSGVS